MLHPSFCNNPDPQNDLIREFIEMSVKCHHAWANVRYGSSMYAISTDLIYIFCWSIHGGQKWFIEEMFSLNREIGEKCSKKCGFENLDFLMFSKREYGISEMALIICTHYRSLMNIIKKLKKMTKTMPNKFLVPFPIFLLWSSWINNESSRWQVPQLILGFFLLLLFTTRFYECPLCIHCLETSLVLSEESLALKHHGMIMCREARVWSEPHFRNKRFMLDEMT